MEIENKNFNEAENSVLNIADVINCPDLTDLWFITNSKRQRGTITKEQAKEIYDALNTLEKHELCQLKFGI